MFDPYEVLGVTRDADKKAIRAAYRRLAKTLHPDAGGAREAFEQLQRSHDLLLDDDRRARFDATGETDDAKAEANPDAAALAIINQMLANILAGPADPVKADLVASMVAAVDNDLGEYRKRVAMLKTAADRLVKVRKRFKRKGEGENAIARMLDWQAQQIANTITATEKSITDTERAGELLGDYAFDWERPVSPMMSAFPQGGALRFVNLGGR